jgi:predicted AAA+ superfamily ATPase
MYKRSLYNIILKRLKESRKFIQILSGPRQTGKTTLVQQIIEESNISTIYALADDTGARSKR